MMLSVSARRHREEMRRRLPITRQLSSWQATVCLGVALCLLPRAAEAQAGTNVLVVVNTSSAHGDAIASRYFAARAIPADHIVRLTTALTDDIERNEFERTIEAPIASWINSRAAHDRILYIVLTKGIPLRIRGSGGLAGTMASVDSELTLLYRKLTGVAAPPQGHIPNPYFHAERPLGEARPFSHAAADIYLVSRLDGFTPADVAQLIDRGGRPQRDGEILLDQRAALLGERRGDVWLAAAARALEAEHSGRVVLESTREPAAGRKDLLGYYSWGSNDASIKARRLGLGFVPGAIAAMFVSTDGRTFSEPPPAWTIGVWTDPRSHHEGSPQSLIGDLIREGVTGVAGHVAEPFLDAAIRPQILFPAYMAGFNLAESFHLALPYLSWQTIVVGDPLCAPFRKAHLPVEQAEPPIDPETELPAFFSARRLAALTGPNTNVAAAKLLLRAESRLARSDRAGALDALRQATAADARLIRARLMLASLEEEAGNFKAAMGEYKSVLAVEPDNVMALNNLAYALAVRTKAPADALPLAVRAYRAVQRAPEHRRYAWLDSLFAR